VLLVDTLAILGWKRTWAWALVHLGWALFLCLWPGLRLVAGTPGFEFAFAQGLLTALSAGHLGIMAASRARDCRPSAGPGSLVLRAWLPGFLAALVLLAFPLGTVLVAGQWNGVCNYGEGLLFYLLLPVASAFWSSAVGTGLGLCVARRFLAGILFTILALGSLGYSILRLMREAPIFGYDPFFGHFPGALYDELLTVGAPLWYFRLETVLLGTAVLLFARAFADPATGVLRWRARRVGALGGALPFLVGAALLRLHAGELGYFVSTADVARALGATLETEHFVIHLSPEARAQRGEEIELEHEFRYDQLRRYLGIEPAGKIHSFLYPTGAEKARLMGARQVSIAKPWIRQIHLNDVGFPHPALRHELAHVFGGAFGSWFGVSARSPFSYNVCLIEGLAVAADWNLGFLTGHQWARAAREVKGRTVPGIQDLLGMTGFWGEGASVAYTLCGSFSRHLIDRHGAARFRDAYREGDLAKAYGRPVEELVKEWESALSSIEVDHAGRVAAERYFGRPSIFRRVCAHEVARLVDRARRARAAEEEIAHWRKIQKLDPARLTWAEELAQALMRAGRLAEAHALVEAESPRHPEAARRLAELQGDVYWRMGQMQEARRIFGRLLGQGAPPDDARRLAVKVAAIDQPVAEPWVRRFFLEADRDRSLQLLDLRELVAAAPTFALGRYLLGRQLVFSRRYREAADHLAAALRQGLPGLEIGVEARRLLGLATFQLGDYGGAARIFADLLRSGAPEGTLLEARDWMERCRFVAHRKRLTPVGPLEGWRGRRGALIPEVPDQRPRVP
jgi:tetratricopeptide (TPR) repeat protein